MQHHTTNKQTKQAESSYQTTDPIRTLSGPYSYIIKTDTSSSEMKLTKIIRKVMGSLSYSNVKNVKFKDAEIQILQPDFSRTKAPLISNTVNQTQATSQMNKRGNNLATATHLRKQHT